MKPSKSPLVLGILAIVLCGSSPLFSQQFTDGVIDFIFKPANNWTQFAIWIEDEEGNYVRTIFITNFIGRRGGGNRSSDSDIDTPDGNRLSALPVWSHRRGVIDSTFDLKNYYPPASHYPSYPADIDAISAATPGAKLQTKTWRFSALPTGRYSCYIEVNRSYDFNDDHSYSFYRGQPSLVWNSTLMVSARADSSTVLNYLGYGSTDGSDGEINPPDATITTAVDLLQDLGGFKFKTVYTPDAMNAVNKPDNLTAPIFSLRQNEPNPFNSMTEIGYFLPRDFHVNLTIFDLSGRKVAVLIDALQSAGAHRVSWIGCDDRGRQMPSGLYLYKLQADEHIVSKVMILLQ